MRYLIYSNYREITEAATLPEAKRAAVAESRAFDDVVTIEDTAKGVRTHAALYGSLYSLRHVAPPRMTAREQAELDEAMMHRRESIGA